MGEVNILWESVNSLLGVLLTLSLIFLYRMFKTTLLKNSFRFFLLGGLLLMIKQSLLILSLNTELINTMIIIAFYLGFYKMRKYFLCLLSEVRDSKLLNSIIIGSSGKNER